MRKPSGFTLLEVLVAAVVLVIALFGILSAGFNAVKKAGVPDAVEQAALLANERLSYFRAQPDPYLAVGGVYFAPPVKRIDPDLNTPVGTNITLRFQQPTLYLREFLDGTNQNRDAGALDAQANRFSNANPSNYVPPTATTDGAGHPLTGIMPANDLAAPVAAGTTYWVTAGTAGLAAYADLAGTNYYYQSAPRAHPEIYNHQPIPAGIRFVREVWVQTSLPSYQPTDVYLPAPDGGPAYNAPNFGALGNTLATSGVQTQVSLPPYTVAVTVVVYARDPSIISFYATGGNATQRQGLGYDITRPLARMVGYYGLNNALSP